MENIVFGIVLLSCLFAVYRAAPQDDRVAPAEGDGDAVRKIRSINITASTLLNDGLDIAKVIGSKFKKNAEAVASAVDKKIASAPKFFTSNADNGDDEGLLPVAFHNGKPKKPRGPKGNSTGTPPPPPTTTAASTR